MPVLTIGDLRRLLADPSLPDTMPVVSWSADFTGGIEGVMAVGVIEGGRRIRGGLFIGEDALTAGLDELSFERRLWGDDDADQST